MSDGLGDLKADDIPKEELLHLCMKMNKRMQAIENKGKELLKKKNQLQTERQKLLTLIESTLNQSFHVTNEQDLDLNVIEKTWNDFDIQRLAKVKEYERKIQDLLTFKEQATANPSLLPSPAAETASNHAATPLAATAAFIASSKDGEDAKDYQSIITRLEVELAKATASEKLLKEQLKLQETISHEKQNEHDQLRKENELIKTNCEEKIVYMQMTIHQQKQKEEAKQQEYQQLKHEFEKCSHRLEEKEILLQTNKEMLVALQARLMEIEPELSSYKDKIKELDRRFSALQVLKYEQDTVINSLKSDLKNSLQEKEKLLVKIKELEEAKLRTDGQSSKLLALQEEMNRLNEEIEEKSSLIIRLRSEIQTAEKNHAIRVAMLATSEAQNVELQKTIDKKDEENKELIDRITQLQIDYSTLETALKERAAKSNKEIESLEEQLAKEKKDYESLANALKAQQDETVESLKKDFNKKSAMARSLLSEREEEVRVLSKKIHELQEEISSGAPSERKIFELAQVQSKREAFHGIHRDTREIAFQQLQSALAAKDFELAQSQQLLSDLSNEINDLRKIKQREGINMDYLKNVVFQYMTFPINSSERNALIPVLAMLLQFSPKEMMEIQKSVQTPIWGNRPVKEVKRIEFTNKSATSSSSSSSSVPVSSSNRATNIPGNSTSIRSSNTLTANIPKATTALSVKPPNREYFLENENIAASKEFPSLSFDLMSPKKSLAAVSASNPTTPHQKPQIGLTERKDSEASENDFDLRQKLKTITSDILDMSLSEDVERTGSNSQRIGHVPPVTNGSSADLARKDKSDSYGNLQTIDMFSSSSSQLLPDVTLTSATLTQTETQQGIKTTISGTSIDENAFANNSQAL